MDLFEAESKEADRSTLLTIEEAAAELALTVRQLQTRMRKGEFPRLKIVTVERLQRRKVRVGRVLMGAVIDYRARLLDAEARQQRAAA